MRKLKRRDIQSAWQAFSGTEIKWRPFYTSLYCTLGFDLENVVDGSVSRSRSHRIIREPFSLKLGPRPPGAADTAKCQAIWNFKHHQLFSTFSDIFANSRKTCAHKFWFPKPQIICFFAQSILVPLAWHWRPWFSHFLLKFAHQHPQKYLKPTF